MTQRGHTVLPWIKEAGIKLFWHTNYITVRNNLMSYNEKFGVYLRNKSTDNMVRNNTITGNEEEITLAGSSINNVIANNTVTGNDFAVVADPSSQTNMLRANR